MSVVQMLEYCTQWNLSSDLPITNPNMKESVFVFNFPIFHVVNAEYQGDIFVWKKKNINFIKRKFKFVRFRLQMHLKIGNV